MCVRESVRECVCVREIERKSLCVHMSKWLLVPQVNKNDNENENEGLL